MKRTLLGVSLALLLAGIAGGDALVLKDGRKFSGRVVEKPDGFEINVEGQTLGFAKDEVDRWVKSPRELTGEADKLYAEAKDIYSKAVEIADDKAAEAKMREALPKVTKAREAYAEARDLFPDGHSDLDAQLVNVMKLMRLVRERLGSQIASAPPSAATTAVVKVKEAPPPKPSETAAPVDPEPAAPPSSSMAEALAVVVDPARRADPAQRAAAKALFRKT
ncbi:MAG TPA: hypothetical protein VEJ18_18920, partial [Planctomycetota bacterium]|nr:hypothetical protein [Planctomycetota bacterium]